MGSAANASHREPWNKGKIVGQKVPFKPMDIWALRVRLQMEGRLRERTMRSPSRANILTSLRRRVDHHFPLWSHCHRGQGRSVRRRKSVSSFA
jgi:hypothetical protein